MKPCVVAVVVVAFAVVVVIVVNAVVVVVIAVVVVSISVGNVGKCFFYPVADLGKNGKKYPKKTSHVELKRANDNK